MSARELAGQLLAEIGRIYPEAKTELSNWSTALQFLVCIVLSAQTTDKQVNKITKNLFEKYPDARSLEDADLEELADTVWGINYYRTKAKHLKEIGKILMEKYNGEPPRDLKKLQELPGVGYKTANVFLNDLFKANQGIAVDTHVMRVARAYGLTESSDPTKIAHDLEKLYSKKYWYRVNSTFVLYGRYILKAKNPDWERVVLQDLLTKEYREKYSGFKKNDVL